VYCAETEIFPSNREMMMMTIITQLTTMMKTDVDTLIVFFVFELDGASMLVY
jgi:hypothetical protein